MSDRSRQFEPKDLIWHLPDLIAGEEPVLNDPAAQRMLREDPAARLAIHAVGVALGVIRGVGQVRDLSLPREWLPHGEQLVQIFSERVAAVLYNAALAEIAETTKGTLYIHGVWGLGLVTPGGHRLSLAVESIRDLLEIPADDVSATVARRAATEYRRGGSGVARALLGAAAKLNPANPNITFWRMLSVEDPLRDASIAGWRQFAARTESVGLRGFALEWLSSAYLFRGSPGPAAASLNALGPTGGWPTLGLNELLAGILNEDMVLCVRGAARLSPTTISPGLRVQLHWKTNSPWARARSEHARVFDVAMALLPPDLAQYIEEEAAK